MLEDGNSLTCDACLRQWSVIGKLTTAGRCVRRVFFGEESFWCWSWIGFMVTRYFSGNPFLTHGEESCWVNCRKAWQLITETEIKDSNLISVYLSSAWSQDTRGQWVLDSWYPKCQIQWYWPQISVFLSFSFHSFATNTLFFLFLGLWSLTIHGTKMCKTKVNSSQHNQTAMLGTQTETGMFCQEMRQ